ncbi:MAG: aminoacyl-tRNA hydrolase [Planctomycetes bacterium]|nr:aminoacyl-tRNA hydrolase [Planctomycetota bacterium]
MPLEADLVLRQGAVIPRAAIRVAYARAGGPGGQHVNKVSTKAEVRLRLEDCPSFSEEDRGRIRGRFPSYFTIEGELFLTSQTHRSQARNLDECLAKLRALLEAGLTVPRRRRPTRPTFASKVRRVEAKRHRSQVKRDRRSGGDGGD